MPQEPFIPDESATKSRRRLLFAAGVVIVIVVLAAVAGFFYYSAPPSSFVPGTVVVVKKGQSLKSVSQHLESAQVIRSAWFLRILTVLQGSENKIAEGEYLFASSTSAQDVVWRIAHGKFGITPVRVTIPEGLASFDIADILKSKLTDFDTKEFLKLAKPHEGYLFPDTYLFLPKTKAAEVIKVMRDTFNKKVASTTKDIVIMSSIVEEEARTSEDRRQVASILYHRLEIGMPLQVDVTFSYIYGTTTPVIYYKDLEVDSLYNTYKHTGLPPGPISNPGLDALLAAASPKPTKYLYYLSDKKGVMHYAVTHDEHVRNKLKYLK